MQHIYITTEYGIIAKVGIQGNIPEHVIARRLASAFEGIGQIEECGDSQLINVAWSASMQEVCAVFSLNLRDMTSHTRKRPVTTFRQMLITAWRQTVYESLKRTAARLERDHTTIIHAVKAVNGWVTVDRKIAKDFEQVKAIVQRNTFMLTAMNPLEENVTTERIECPRCLAHSDATVTDFAPRLHFCQCGHTIMESEWRQVSGQLAAE